MASINTTNYRKDLTVRVYDDFYKFDTEVPVSEYDAVHSYFLRECDTAQQAGNMTVAVFQIAAETNTPVMNLLKTFEGSTGINIDIQIAYWMNLIRSRATLLGVTTVPQPNFYAVRNVVQ